VNYLRKLFWLMVCLCCLPAARAQVTVISGQTINQYGQPLPYTQVRVCSVTSTGVPCTPTAQIYQDYGLTIPAPNPTSADMYGNYTVYAGPLPAPNLYTVQYSPASGITWAYVVNGPGLSASGGTVTGFINALGYNGVPEADQCSGVDAWAQINTCANMLPNGGFEDARGFGATTQTVTTKLTALATPTRPITLELNPRTTFISNVAFSAGSIASAVASGVSGSAGACMVPIANGSAIITPGFNEGQYSFQLGPSAATYDFVCNANMDGTQESMRIDGLSLIGNASATMSGSLLHMRNLFVQTLIENVNTYHAYGNVLTVDTGSDLLFLNDDFLDASPGGGYPGAVVTLNCPTRVTFQDGGIQFNGINNPLIVMNSTVGTATCNPLNGGSYQPTAVHFYNVDFEISAATVGSFSGAPTNVDPIQIWDPDDVWIDGLTLFGLKGAGQNHVVDVFSKGAGGVIHGPLTIDNMTAINSEWTGLSLIHNAVGSPYVSPTQADVYGQLNGSSTLAIGKYRWNGNGATAGSSIDYEDYKNFSNMQALNTNSVINAAQEAGADIGAKVTAALALCSNNCEVDIPAGIYTQTTTIAPPLNTFSAYRIRLLPGAVLNYTGSGCAVTATVAGGPTEGNFEIWGGQINGNPAALGGVCVQPTNKFHIHDMTIVGFDNSNGAGIWLEGPNAGTVENNFVSNSGIGVLATPTFCTGASCTPSTIGSPYSPNNINIINNVLPANGWGIFYDDVTSGSGLTGALGVNISGNDVEEATIGGINIGRSHAATIGPNNYFELDPIGIQVGISSGSNYFASNGTRIVGNYFTVTTIQKYDILLANTMDTIIEGNSQDYASENSSNCFINGLPYVANVSGGELNTVVGNNHVELAGVGNYLCENGSGVIALTGEGSYTQLNQNYFPLLVNSNYVIVSSGTSDTGVAVSGNSTTSSACFVTPENATAGAVGLGSVYFIMTGNNVGTFYHPSSVTGTRWNIWCSGVQN